MHDKNSNFIKYNVTPPPPQRNLWTAPERNFLQKFGIVGTENQNKGYSQKFSDRLKSLQLDWRNAYVTCCHSKNTSALQWAYKMLTPLFFREKKGEFSMSNGGVRGSKIENCQKKPC